MKNQTLKCPLCSKTLEVTARGKSKRFYQCPHCKDDRNEPVLFYQPTSMLLAVRKLEQGALIDLNFNSAKSEKGD